MTSILIALYLIIGIALVTTEWKEIKKYAYNMSDYYTLNQIKFCLYLSVVLGVCLWPIDLWLRAKDQG